MTKAIETITGLLLLLSNTAVAFTSLQPFGVSTLHKHSTAVWAKKNTNKSRNQQQHSNIPTFDMKELKRRIGETMNPYHNLFAYDWREHGERPEHVHIILFQPDTPEQGIHTIEYPKGSGNNHVLAFQSQAACVKFVATLKAQNFYDPLPRRFQLESLEDFCDDLGVFLQVVPNGMDLIPPTKNVQTFGHNPHLQEERGHLDYLFEMFESESDDVGALALEYGGSWE